MGGTPGRGTKEYAILFNAPSFAQHINRSLSFDKETLKILAVLLVSLYGCCMAAVGSILLRVLPALLQELYLFKLS
jgi:hypothetical protein